MARTQSSQHPSAHVLSPAATAGPAASEHDLQTLLAQKPSGIFQLGLMLSPCLPWAGWFQGLFHSQHFLKQVPGETRSFAKLLVDKAYSTLAAQAKGKGVPCAS